jgi:hypothetical protein
VCERFDWIVGQRVNLLGEFGVVGVVWLVFQIRIATGCGMILRVMKIGIKGSSLCEA